MSWFTNIKSKKLRDSYNDGPQEPVNSSYEQTDSNSEPQQLVSDTEQLKIIKNIEDYVKKNSQYGILWDLLIKGITNEEGEDIGGYTFPGRLKGRSKNENTSITVKYLIKKYGKRSSINGINGLKNTINSYINKYPNLNDFFYIIEEYLERIKNYLHSLKDENSELQTPEWPEYIPQKKIYKKPEYKNEETNRYLPFEEARAFVRKLNLKNPMQWRHYCKSGVKPVDIPSNPQQVYKRQWYGINNWLGNYDFTKPNMFTPATSFGKSRFKS